MVLILTAVRDESLTSRGQAFKADGHQDVYVHSLAPVGHVQRVGARPDDGGCTSSIHHSGRGTQKGEQCWGYSS